MHEDDILIPMHADSKEDEEEDAPEVLDADETTEDTSSEEAETISQDEE